MQLTSLLSRAQIVRNTVTLCLMCVWLSKIKDCIRYFCLIAECRNNFLLWILKISSFPLLKGKFSSGIEGALTSTLNLDFNWKRLSEMILCILFWMFSKFIWVTLIQKQQKFVFIKETEFWAWAPRFIMIWNITVRYKFWRTYLFQDT